MNPVLKSPDTSGFPVGEGKPRIAATSPGGDALTTSGAPLSERLGRRLLRHGIALFLLGLVTDRLVQSLAVPRMGVASHLQGVMNGTFLVALGLVWPHLRLRALSLRAAYWLALAGAYLNWAVTLAAAAWGAGPRPCRSPPATTGAPGSAGRRPWRAPRPCALLGEAAASAIIQRAGITPPRLRVRSGREIPGGS
jgi:(hydroxyamino)benzene mutase